MDYKGRLERLRSLVEKEKLDGLFVSNLVNIRYLCGFTGSAGSLVVGRDRALFLSDGRYRTQSEHEVQGAEIEIYRMSDEMGPAIGRAATEFGMKRIGFESEHVTIAGLEKLRNFFDGAEVAATLGLVEGLRRVKDLEEVSLMRKAAEFADAGLAHILERVEVGKTERELALDLEFFMRASGAEGVSFELIVAAAERSALPHADPTERKVEEGRFLLFDLGCRYQGYCSDLTRTVAVGAADDKHREIYEVVAEAQRAGLEAVAPGSSGAEVDRAAREVIERAGHGEAFGHGLGHGVGLEVHEGPSIRITSTDVLEPGNVVTVEPGIYFPEWGGVRIEDLVLVTSEGKEVLSGAPKDLLVL